MSSEDSICPPIPADLKRRILLKRGNILRFLRVGLIECVALIHNNFLCKKGV